MATVGKPVIGVTLGDPWGIGPEVLAVALAQPNVQRACAPVVFGDEETLIAAAALRGVRLPVKLRLIQIGAAPPRGSEGSVASVRRPGPGRPPRGGGRYPIAYLEAAVAAAEAGEIDALCTAPVHKALLAAAGFRHAGHTDYLAERLGRGPVVMLLAGPSLRVALATVHVPLREVAGLLSVAGLVSTLEVLSKGLRNGFAIQRPRLAVCGLNPHAGEGGLLGDEERRLIGPAVRLARRRGIEVEGPLPADSLFALAVRTQRWDAILAMAHDQGLGPLKVLDFERAVNVTLGLSIPRTSPDHGVAYDLAGKGRADARSMQEALLLAAYLASPARGG